LGSICYKETRTLATITTDEAWQTMALVTFFDGDTGGAVLTRRLGAVIAHCNKDECEKSCAREVTTQQII